MSAVIKCDFCGRECDKDSFVRVTFETFETYYSVRTTTPEIFDACTASNGMDTGCAPFVRRGLSDLKKSVYQARADQKREQEEKFKADMAVVKARREERLG